MSDIILSQKDADFIILNLREQAFKLRQSWEKTKELTVNNIEVDESIDDFIKNSVIESLSEIGNEYIKRIENIHKCIELLTVGSEGILKD